MEVAVVGGGAVGLATAVELARRDADVTLFERTSLGGGATGRAAGLCYDAFAGSLDATVARRALDTYRERGLLEPRPYVWVARTESDTAAVREQVARMRDGGVDATTLSADSLAERYPALDTSGVRVAGLARDAGLVDPEAVVRGLADRAMAAGARLEPGTPVSLTDPTTLSTPEGPRSFDAVVVAAGSATDDLVADVGVALAVKPYRAQALVTDSVDASLPAFYDATREFYWRPRGDGLLVGDGAHELDGEGWDRDADDGFVEATLARVRATTELHPATDRSWAGLCTATPDGDPLAGPVADGLHVATGWQGHGLMRAPAVGQFLAATVLDRERPFGGRFRARADPTRFDGDESFAALGDPTRDW